MRVDDLADKIRARITEQISRAVERRTPVAVLLSAGVDSMSLLLACVDLGLEVRAYSFGLGSGSARDVRIAEHNTFLLDVPWTWIPLREERIPWGVGQALSRGLWKKSAIECTWPMLESVAAIKEDAVLAGHAAENPYGLSKRAAIRWLVKESAAHLDAYRDYVIHRPNVNQNESNVRLFQDMGKTLLLPFHDSAFYEAHRGLTWDELNKPRQKEPIRRAFLDRCENKAVRVFNHVNLQLGDSGISTAFLAHAQSLGYRTTIGWLNAERRAGGWVTTS